MKVNKDLVFLTDIIEYAGHAEQFLKNANKKSFLANMEKQFSVARAVEVVGEAVANLSDTLKSKHPEIDWRSIKGMRNLLIHNYSNVDAEIVWKSATKDLPLLKKQILKILEEQKIKNIKYGK